MQYNTYLPSRLLSGYVKFYWTLDAEKQSNVPGKERIFPDGCVELIFHHGDLFKKYSTPSDSFYQPRSFVHGQLTRFIEVQPTGAIGIFSVRFSPEGLYPFVDIDIDELTDRTISAEDLWGRDGVILEDQMMDAQNPRCKIQLVEAFLLKRLRVSKDATMSVDHCVRSIVSSRGFKSVEMLAAEVNIGRRQLERRFSAAVGMSPKLLTRIVRFQNTIQQMERRTTDTLTGIACANGFYDQAHFIKDFKEFTGLNPRQYFGVDLEFARYLTSE